MKPDAYERFVSQLVDVLAKRDLTSPPVIEQRRKLKGRSGQLYEIDLSYRFHVAGVEYLTVIECKCWNHPVGRDIVSAFKAVTDDISAHKGIVVTTKGFQSGAIEAAGAYGIALLKVSTDGERETIKHLEGEDRRAREDLRMPSCYDASKPLSHHVGVSTMATHIIDYVAARYGNEAAAFLATDEIRSTEEIADDRFRAKAEDQLRRMHKGWILEYLEIETGGLNIIIEPSTYLRIINMKAYINYLRLTGQ